MCNRNSRRQKGTLKILEEIMAPNLSNLMKNNQLNEHNAGKCKKIHI
jgi:hypothetical protein